MKRMLMACLLFGLSVGLARAETRLAVIAEKSPQAEKLGTLLELRLAKSPSVKLVERSAIEQVLREQQLQAVLAADAPGKRAAMGKLLGADLLVFLTGDEKPKPHVMVVVCETRRGLRLCCEPVVLSDRAEADVEAIFQKVEAAARKRKQEIASVVAVPPLLNNSLTHDADRYQGALARLVESTLLKRPGLLVVEFEEAKAVAREMAIGGQSGPERRLPLYLVGQFRMEGVGEKRRVEFAWKLMRGEKELDACREEQLPWDKLADQLSQTAGELIDKAAGKTEAKIDPVAEAKQLAQREEAFLKAGFWQESLSLAEASLLLWPDQPAVHGDALRAMLEINESRPCMNRQLRSPILGPQDALVVVEWLRTALPHLDAYFCGTEVTMAHYWFVTFKWQAFNLRPLTPEVRDACRSLRREMRETANHILAAKAAGHVADLALSFLWRWTDPPMEPPDDALDFLWRSVGNQFPSFEPDPIRQQWLGKHLPEICRNRLRLLRDFAWMTGWRMGQTCDELVVIRGPGVVRKSTTLPGLLPADPAYRNFLDQVEKLGDPRMLQLVNQYRAELERRPQRLAELEALRKQDHYRPLGDAPAPCKDPEVVFAPLTLREVFPDGREKAIVSKDGLPPRGMSVATRMLEMWLPLGDGCDLVYFGHGTTLWRKGKTAAEPDSLALMKEKGRLHVLPLEIRRSHPECCEGNLFGSTWDHLTNVCWDGKYVWALHPGDAGPLAVVEPREERIWKAGHESGLPPSMSCAIAPLGPGKVCIAGYFGRLWIALATFDPRSGVQFEVIHEAREVPKTNYGADTSERYATNLAWPIHYAFTLAPAPAAGQPPRQRVVVGRFGTGPLLIDPETRSVTAAPVRVEPSLSLFADDDAVYWQFMERANHLGPLCRLGFPDFNNQVVNEEWRKGECVVFEGRYHLMGGNCTGYYVAKSLRDSLRSLRCDIPGSCWYPKLFISRHYGLLLSTEQGVYSVELKNPQSATGPGLPK